MRSIGRRSLVVVGMIVATNALVGCGGDPPRIFVSTDGSGTVAIASGCFDDLTGSTELQDGQIVVSELHGTEPKDGDCASGFLTEHAPGPDVVFPDGEQRWVLVGDRYREVDYCGLETRRCVPFSTDAVPASCSEESARFATIGELRGVFPFEVVRCDDRFLMVDIDPCSGFHGDDGPSCEGGSVRFLYWALDGTWRESSYRQELMCPDDGDGYRPAEMPEWVCDP